MEDGETTEETPAVCNCTEKCKAEAVNINCPVCSTDRTQCAGAEAEPEPEEPEEPQKEQGGLLIVLVLSGAGGAALHYFQVLKPKKDAAKGSNDLSDYDFDDYDENEEEQPEESDNGELEDEALLK